MFDDPSYLPDEWLIELGRISQSWAAFEQFFNLMLQKLAGFDDPVDATFTILVAHSSMPQRLDMFSALCAQHLNSYPHLKDYKAVVGKIREAQAARNKFAHNIIGIDKEDSKRATISTVSARGELKVQLTSITINELRAASDKIRSVVKEMYLLVLAPNWAETGHG